jgi:hypothetical protein
MSALIVDAVVRDGRIHITDENFYRTRAERFAKKLGNGTMLKIRIEPEEEAISDGQRRYYFGRIVKPLVEYTGDLDVHDNFKAALIQDGRTSITQLSREEMAFFIEAAEFFAHTKCPDAFALEDRR